MAKVQEIGPYSAYAIAVKYGYKGTEEEWVKEQEANRKAAEAAATAAAQSAKDAAASASGVAQSGQQAVQSIKDAQTAAEQAIDTAKQQAVQAAQAEAEKAATSAGQAASSAAEAAQSATNAAAEVGKVQSAGTSAVQAVQAAQNTATEAVSAAQQTATQAVSQAQTAAVSAVQEAGTTQTSAIESAGTAAVADVSNAKTEALSQISAAGTAQVSAVGTAGEAAVEDVNDAKTAALEAIDAANAALPSPTQSDAGKVPTVKADGSAYELAGPYAPLSAAIRLTASGNPVNITDSVEWPLLGLKVYGKSTQDGTPSPENPVPIVSAGDGGSIGLTVSNSADQSQSLTISTPNGLPGIPVDSGGNYTDASGHQWLSDCKDFITGKHTQRVGHATQWTIRNATSGGYFLRATVYPNGAPKANGKAVTTIASKLITEDVWNTKGSEPYAFVQGSNYDGIVIWPGDQFQDTSALQHLVDEGHLEAYYELANPVETPLSPEEIAAYRALHTYDGTTVVSTAEDVAGLEVKYVADAQKYIDDRLAAAESHIQEIAAAQLNAQTGG